MSARGVVYVHAAPPALCPHLEWAIAGVIGVRVKLSWQEQGAKPGCLRSEVSWTGDPGTGGKLATALRAWPMVSFEVTEDASEGNDGERICHVPGRPVWRAAVSANGDVMVGENQLRAVLARATSVEEIRHTLADLLGESVDAELEPYRRAGEGSAVTWLHQVG